MTSKGILRLPLALGRPALLQQILLILGAFAIFGLIVLFYQKPVGAVFAKLFEGSFGSLYSFTNTLSKATPLLLTALCTLIPARLGLVIIGNQGALLMGGLASAVFALVLPPALGIIGTILILTISFIAGGVWIGFSGLMYKRRNVDPTISSLLMYYIAWSIFKFLVEGPLKDPSTSNKPSTHDIAPEFRIGTMGDSGLHLGLIVGIIACILMFFLIYKSKIGFKARITGGNDRVAASLGLPRDLLIIGACFLGGGFAGLAGGIEITAVQNSANAALNGFYGTTGILVAFLARQNPLLVIPAAILIGGLQAGGDSIDRAFGIPNALILVLQGLLFLAILIGEGIKKKDGAKI